MKRRTLITLILSLLAAGSLATGERAFASIMPVQSQKEKPTTKVAPKAVAPRVVAPKVTTKPDVDVDPQLAPGATTQTGQVSLKLERGGKVVVSNRNGQIRITGWDSDMVEARAEGEEGSEAVQVRVTGEASRSRVALSVPAYGSGRGHNREINLDIKMPRYADLESIESDRGDIEITGLEGTVSVTTGHGTLAIKNVGSLKAVTRHGDVTIAGVKGDASVRSLNGDLTVDNISGALDLAATNGNIIVRTAGSNVQANSSSGDIELRCVKANATVNTASGSVMLVGVGGNIDANTASGDVIFKGTMRASGNYRLKTISGQVEMAVQPDPPGFTATLITYSGEIETDFPLTVNAPLTGPINRRIVGVYKDGQTQVTLDSFSGTVSIVKGVAGSQPGCK
jgi:DUF4097 and DUF4098 domain-containing protein YvlB